jgi:phospholipid-binding lipoprotein MlaA
MKKMITLLTLALLFQASTASAESLLPTYAGATNMVSEYGHAGSLPVADTGHGAPLLLAAAGDSPSASDSDLAFLDEGEEVLEVYDPLETFNRGMFWFNDKLYFYLMKPIARGYRWIAPEPFRVAIGNVFSNLATPIRVVNAGLQGKFGDAGNELVRFGTNTTLGIGGLFDPSREHFGIAKKDEDTGQTMGYYGIGSGPYLVLPFLGPSSFRDGIGLFADSHMDLVFHIWENSDYWYAVSYRAINKLSLDKDTYEGIKKDEIDPYLFVRDAWTQYRQNLVEN